MKYRKPLRLKGYDYCKPGYYFVTIRSGNKNYPFCKIIDGEVHQNEVGMIIEEQWKWLFDRYDHILIDEYVIMPDHFHAIIHIISGSVGDGPYFAEATNGKARPSLTIPKKKIITGIDRRI